MKVGGSLLYVTDGWAHKNTNLNVWQYQCWSFTLSVYLKDFVLKTYFLKKGSFEIPIWTFEERVTMIDIGLMPVMSEAPPLALDGSLSS